MGKVDDDLDELQAQCMTSAREGEQKNEEKTVIQVAIWGDIATAKSGPQTQCREEMSGAPPPMKHGTAQYIIQTNPTRAF